MKQQARLFFIALQFLTRLPIPHWVGFHPDWLSRSAVFFPLVGAIVGLCNGLVWWLCGHWLPNSVSIAVMMAASLLITGAFHEDGFADVCDGFGGGATRERILSIMKDSRVGAYGAMGIAMLLIVKWTTLAALPVDGFVLLLITTHMLSRWYATALIWRLPYVRADEDGKAKPLANKLSGMQWMMGGIFGAIPVIVMLSMSSSVNSLVVILQAIGVGVLLSAACALLAAVYFNDRLGGYTGDCLGATQQITEISFLLGALAALKPAGAVLSIG